MKKISVKGQVEQFDVRTGRFSGVIATDGRYLMSAMMEFVGAATWKMGFGKDYKGRTKGEKSQNHHIWGHLQQIAMDQGEDIDVLHYIAKYKAISWGYPFTIVEGVKVPWSEKRIDTKQAGILIEAIHWYASELGVELYEGDEDENE